MAESDLIRIILAPVFLTILVVVVKKKKHIAARLLMAIGVLHILAGSWVGRDILARFARESILGGADSGLGDIPANVEKEMVFWFELWGVWLFFLGQLLTSLEKQGGRPPAAFAWGLVAACLVSGIFVPKAGFWWLLIPAFLIVRDSRNTGPRP